MWNPVVLTPARPLPEALQAIQPLFSTYALGWSVRDYRGVRLVMHGGGVFGSIAIVAWNPSGKN